MEKHSKLPRDIFLDQIHAAARNNKNIYVMTADLGSDALDRFRAEMGRQFIHAGISEQNMIDVAAGMALNGKIVYVYAMAPFVTLRCFEQIKVAIASMELPLTIIGVGVGYSYEDAGPTHYATEDISCMRSLGGIEILTPGDELSVIQAARLTFSKPALRYIRLDRTYLPTLYNEGDNRFMQDGIAEIERGEKLCIMTAGYMLQKARAVKVRLESEGIKLGIIDVFRLKPINGEVLRSVLAPYSKIITLEEHFLSGGLGGALVEAMVDNGVRKDVKRIGIQDHYYCENGGRNYLHQLAGIDVDTVTDAVRSFAKL